MRPLTQMGRFATVVIDPPWPLRRFGPKKAKDFGFDYPTMELADIAALPIADLCAENARVFLWVGNKHLPIAFELLAGWHLTYSFTMAWVKPGGVKSPVSPMFNAEWVVVGRRGSPRFLDTRQFMTAHSWPRGRHSEKPEGFYDLLRRVTPAPRIDVFGRRRIAGFTSWGNEAPDTDPEPDHYQHILFECDQ